METQYLKVKEVANILDCSQLTVRRYLKDGRLEFLQPFKGAGIRIHIDALIDYLERNNKLVTRDKIYKL